MKSFGIAAIVARCATDAIKQSPRVVVMWADVRTPAVRWPYTGIFRFPHLMPTTPAC